MIEQQITQESIDAAVAEEPLMQWFNHEHLPPHLAKISAVYTSLARTVCIQLPRSPERTVALRKLLESKDAAVRCAVGQA